MKHFYTGPAVNTDLLVLMLEKHGIIATEEILETDAPEDDLNREARVLVREEDYDRAYQLFYADRQDEL